MSQHPKPVILCILDGWGDRQEAQDNAIATARTPHWDQLCEHYPHGRINASEGAVGLPDGQMGNSEVGHMNIGAGRVVMQDLPRIDTAIANGEMEQHPLLQDFITQLKTTGGACHLMGLMSDGGVHAHQHHIVALAKIVANAGVPVWIHAFLDGRDTPPKSAADYMAQCEQEIVSNANIKLATISGRYYAMDRDNRWDRVVQAYEAMVNAKGECVEQAQEAIATAYQQNVTDEFILPTVIDDYKGMADGDGLLMANFRADRARQMAAALVDPAFDGFKRSRVIRFEHAIGMSEYSAQLTPLLPPLFPSESLDNILGEVIANAGMAQLRIAETEKYAHVTFFMSGGREETFAGEQRVLVPSPNVPTYDLQPEMSAFEVTDRLVEAIDGQQYDLIIVNYANTDMVGHTGNLEAATKAVEAVDQCLGRLVAAVESVGGAMLVTADHGNAECMRDAKTGQPHTAHTLNLVPVVLCSADLRDRQQSIREGRLADIAPTLLEWLKLDKPSEMTGESLLKNSESVRASA